MTSKPDIPVHLRELFPKGSDALLSLFKAAEEDAALLRSDLHTLRDWLDIAGYDEECLHVLLLLMILAQEEGSLCIELSVDSLTRRFVDLAPPAEARAWAERLVRELASSGFGNLIGTSPDDQRPVIRHEVGGRCWFYFQKYLRHELEFAQALRGRLTGGRQADAKQCASLMRAVLDEQPLLQAGKPLVLDGDQRRALELALTRDLVLVSGGPGTGKTSIVVTLLRCLIRSGLTPGQIALAAPTGRAAQRLADAIRLGIQSLPPGVASPDASLRELDATTLHQLLEYMPSRAQFRRHADNPLPQNVVIVDEVSMVGMVLMARLFQALRPETRLIMLGDKDQLPSVEAGAVLAHVIPDGDDDAMIPEPAGLRRAARQPQLVRQSLVILRTNHRSELHIRDIAAAVNRQDAKALDDLPVLALPKDLTGERGVRYLEQKAQTPAEIRRIVQLWADQAFLTSGFKELVAECAQFADDEDSRQRHACLAAMFRLLEQSRILTLVREGPWGCDQINGFLDQYLRPRLSRSTHGLLFPGAPVLITRNDHGRQLFNGDVGLTVPGPDEALRVVFPREGAYLSLPADALPAHELGFALTVHKSQGSEYGQVMLIFPPSGGRRLLTKELVYTGITRAKDLAVLCATREVLRLAIERRCVRESALLRLE